MTDPKLVHRAEQSLLGALMTGHADLGGLPLAVTPDCFADVRHQAIFIALTNTAIGERGSLPARFSRRARAAGAYMETLPGLCEDAGHVSAYARMVAEAKAERDTASQATAIPAANGGQILAGAAERLAWTAHAAGSSPAEATRLASALRGRARRWIQRPSACERVGVPPARAEDFQDLVLASLMRYPDEARGTVGLLPAEAFAGGPHRELFSLITQLIQSGSHIDPLIVAWAAEAWSSAAPDRQLTPSFVLGVGSIGTMPGIGADAAGRPRVHDPVRRARRVVRRGNHASLRRK